MVSAAPRVGWSSVVRHSRRTWILQGIRKAIPGLDEAESRQILRWMENLGLLQGKRLSKIGQQVAEDDLVPIPEQGVYRVWSLQHELTGLRWMDVLRLKPHDEGGRQSLDDRSLFAPTAPTAPVFVSLITKEKYQLLGFQKAAEAHEQTEREALLSVELADRLSRREPAWPQQLSTSRQIAAARDIATRRIGAGEGIHHSACGRRVCRAGFRKSDPGLGAD